MEIELKKLYETVSSIHDEMYYLRERQVENTFSWTIHDIGCSSDVSNIYFMLVAGKKKCKSSTEQPIPEWVG